MGAVQTISTKKKIDAMKRLLIYGVVCCVGWTCACVSKDPKTHSQPMPVVLKKVLISPLTTTDPLRALEVVSAHVISQIYDTLFELDDSLNLKRHLVQSYTYNDKEHLYEFELRKGVLFTDGEELTSDDVLFTFKRFCAEGRQDIKITNVIQGCNRSFANRESGGSLGIVKKDRYRFSIKLNSDYPPFLINLASHNFLIIRNNFGGIKEDSYWKSPAGTGAYTIESVSPEQIVLNANPNYFLGKPSVDRVEYTVVLYADSQNNIQSGYFDDLWPLSPKGVIPAVYVPQQTNFASVCFIGFNLKKKPFSNIWFRRAIKAFIDNKKIIGSIGGKDLLPAGGFIPFGVLGYVEKKSDPANIELGHSFLKRAGFKNISDVPPLTLYATHLIWEPEIFEEVKRQLRRAGLNVTVIVGPLKEHLERVKRNEVDFSMVNIKLDQPETYHLLGYFKTNHPLRPFNAYDDQFDKLLEMSQTVSDRLHRAEIYRLANEYIYDHVWTVNVLYRIHATNYVNPKFRFPKNSYLGPDFIKIRDIHLSNVN